MSLRVHTQGGGAGGASASIFVTGLSETDTVTAAKDGKTVNGKWVTKKVMMANHPLIPAMTSDVSPSGVASASLMESGRGAWNAFDKDNSTYAYGYNAGVPLPWHTQYEFPEEVSIDSFSYVVSHASAGSGGRTTGHEVQISENGTKWETLWSGTTSRGASDPEHGTINLESAKTAKYVRWATVSDVGTTHQSAELLFEFQVYGDVEAELDGFEISKIKDYGMWTVTATNGEKTTTQDVLVDAAVEYEIKMDYSLLFKLDFANGTITPAVNRQNTEVTTNGTIVLDEGSAYFNYNGEIRMTPPVFVSGEKSWHWKFKPTKIDAYTQFYCDSSATSATSIGGFNLELGSDANYRGFREYGGGKSAPVVELPALALNVEYDIIVTTTGDTTPNGTKLYVNGVLVDEGTLRLDSVSCDGAFAYIGYNYASPYGYAGYIYLYEFFGRELSAEEVLTLQKEVSQ